MKSQLIKLLTAATTVTFLAAGEANLPATPAPIANIIPNIIQVIQQHLLVCSQQQI